MADPFDVLPKRGRAPGDDYFRRQGADSGAGLVEYRGHPLDSEASRGELRQLLEWYFYEKERQSLNRLEMAMDCDFYDNLQWDPEDAATLRDRGQMPLVYNEVAPMVDWLIGTERRTRVDWRVLPRTEDDVELADTKTKVLKYVSDINRVQFLRSRAFSDAVKAGVGWMDDGVRDDPTQDILYSKYEDWRNVLWDSSAYEHDLSDARFLFRWRWVDEDVALLMFPDRADAIREAVEEGTHLTTDGWEEETWYSAQDLQQIKTGTIYAAGVGQLADARRRRVKLIEAQYRKPATVRVVADGALQGAILNPRDAVLADAVGRSGSQIVDKLMMRVHVAVFTDSRLLALGPSPYRHNRFSLTPIWCYRRSRDRMPYGVIRRVRDMQQDLNKRASKALFMLNSNQILAEEGATDDWDALRDEADRPDGVVVYKPGRKLELRRDTDAATGQVTMMEMATRSIQRSGGVADENMGRQTNAVSGEAIKARQLQGGVVTTEPFDNLRLATQEQGAKQLSLVEQWYTQQKVVRLTGAKGALEWVKVNVPELQPDGSVRFLNDITSSMADFVVSEQDYSGTLRQVMFESLNQLATRLPPEVSLRIWTIAMEFSDLPNKDEIAEQFRKLTGERDPNKPMSPEEQAQAEGQAAQQAEAMALQREQAMAALGEQQAKVRELNARAAKLEAEAQAVAATAGGGASGDMEQALMQVRADASAEMDRVSEELRRAQAELANRTIQINRDADTKLQVARIDADAKTRVAEIQAASDRAISALQKRLEDTARTMDDRARQIEQRTREAVDAAQAKAATAAPAQSASPAVPAPAPAAPMTINVQVDAGKGEVKKSVVVKRDAAGNIVGAEVQESPEPAAADAPEAQRNPR
jgi:hypothetical protein